MADPVSRLGEIRARLAAATPAPWESLPGGWIDGPAGDPLAMLDVSTEDAEFIAAAPADVGWLLDHIEQLQRDITEMDSAYASKASECTDLHGLCTRQRDLIAEFRLRDESATRTIKSQQVKLAHDIVIYGELERLRSFAQSLLTLETDMKARAGAGLGTIIEQARTALGADDDR